ncbi:hypothetical protein GCWU000324_01448 [Kingella oralis ATCC 51147]|uniref:Uncharacterized protein n=1 Tax=Kingella oralis ATCC 51147 TaxID=629741 RepID=C4GKE5_9NEIS|nr:hypothetical protein GCWU000324_01448 [Kingella oralis ATCC 51147]
MWKAGGQVSYSGQPEIWANLVGKVGYFTGRFRVECRFFQAA